ncbi:MAG: SMP-30/gluconolactonase/LRE family protein [Burkholderiales bacterium]|nr:SMP-30/gluconolactonase/LRE family protein [Burkholderiales bacterium]
MRRLVLTVLLFLLAIPFQAAAWNRSPATVFATLPVGATPPEGITVDVHGNVYVSTFGFPASGPTAGPGQLFVFDRQGKVLRQVAVAGASAHLLGLAFHPLTGDLLVIDFGAGKVLKVNPLTGAASVFTHIGGSAGLNALAFDSAGNVYISDSFQGIIWQTGPAGGPASAWLTSPLLTTSGVPPFGATGLAFNRNGTALLVANTGNDSVVKIPVTSGAPGAPSVLAYSINGADGLIIDEDDNIWVAANQADELVVLDPSGKVIAKLGDFGGINTNGAVNGLLFPASLVFSGEHVLVTNLVLDLRLFGVPTVDSQWTAEVTRYTVAKIHKRIPRLRDLH